MEVNIRMNESKPSVLGMLDKGAAYNQSASAVRRRIIERATSYYPDLTRQSLRVQVFPERHIFASRTHFKCIIRGRNHEGKWVQHRIYLKRSQQVDVEYENLMRLWDGHFRHASVNRIPRPLDFWRDWRILLTEYVAGQSQLLPWLLKYVSPLGTFVASQEASLWMERVADWLVEFQLEADVSLGKAHVISDPEQALGDLTSTRSIPRHSRESIAEYLHSAFSSVHSVPPVLSHGDFTARNILQDRDSVTIVDWELSLVRRHPAYDVQSFLINLERRRSYPFSNPGRVGELRETFLNRYIAQTPFEFDEQSLAVIRVVRLLHQLREQVQALERGPIGAFLKRRRSYIRYVLVEIEKAMDHG